MTEERSELADWLRALQQLQPENEETRESIARMMGLRLRSPEKRAAPVRPAVRLQSKEAPAAAPPKQEAAPESRSRRRLESTLVPGNASRNPAPQWLAAAHSLEPTGTEHLRPVLPLEPLFPRRTSRAILSGALATPSANGPLDFERVIEILSRAEPIEELPRVSIPTLARGVQLLIDRGESMQPFAADQAALRASLTSVAGRDRTVVLYFEGTPLWGAGVGPRDEWPEYRMPAPGTPVVALTDLGIARPPGSGGFAGPADWQEFADALRRAGCPFLALVPYPPRRWPPLARSMTIVQWDRATTAAVVRRAIPSGLRVGKGG